MGGDGWPVWFAGAAGLSLSDECGEDCDLYFRYTAVYLPHTRDVPIPRYSGFAYSAAQEAIAAADY